MFNHKIGNVFKNSQDMKMFIKHCLISAVERDEDQSGVLYSYSKLDNFVQLIIGCSFNWIRNPSGFTLKNVIEDGEVLEIISHPDLLENSSSQQTYTFDQIPFKRILSAFTNHFFTLFHEEEKDNLEKMQKKNQILEMFSNVFKEMNPSRYPGFAFAWVELISSPAFMPMMLTGKNEHNLHERWFKMHELFNKLFGFLKENIYENCSTTPALEKLFEGTLKLCLVVLHDYPEFLCYYYFEFINHLPLYQTVNLRNMILAAYPKEMRLPDPININIESFPESTSIYTKDRQSHLQNYIPDSEYYAYKADLDKYLANPEDETLLSICKRIEQNQKVKEYRRIINTGLVHSTILYLTYDIEEIKTVEKLENPKLSQKFIFMCRNLSTPVRDILLNCMFDELRLLNKSTVFFMNALLQVFKAKGEHDKIIRSQICRILSDRGLKINKQQFERQKSQRIQPWGLLAFTARITNEEEFKNIANN